MHVTAFRAIGVRCAQEHERIAGQMFASDGNHIARPRKPRMGVADAALGLKAT